MNAKILYYPLYCLVIAGFLENNGYAQQRETPRSLGITFGIFDPGELNAITDVEGVKVGHLTLDSGVVQTGVTVVLPHHGNLFQRKVPAAIYVGNGFGKLAGYSQVEELGNIETPIALTNTLSVPTVSKALMKYTLSLDQNQGVRSVNPIVGETNDGRLNDIRGFHIREEHVLLAIKEAKAGAVEQGAVGAGRGTICFGFKGGIGTASRQLPKNLGSYRIGVLVQTNFGGVLEIAGVPVGKELGQYYLKDALDHADGSCMIIVATDAPMDVRNLKRIAKRALLGMAKTGAAGTNGSGDYAIVFSTTPGLRIPHQSTEGLLSQQVLTNDKMSPLFQAVIEATEEAIINSLFLAQQIPGTNVKALPLDKVKMILRKY